MRIASGIVVWLLALSLGRAAYADFEAPLAITNATIIAAPGRQIDNGTILIEERRITAVGPDVAVPAHARRLDGSGLYVYPGFIDANSHIGLTAKEPNDKQRRRFEDEYPDVRETPQSATVQAHRRLIHPHWRAEEMYDAEKVKPDDIRKAGFTTVLISLKPAIFSGQSAVIQMGDLPLRRSIVASAVAQHSAFVTTNSSGSAHRYPVTTMGAMAAFRQTMLDARWHRALLEWQRRHPQGERAALDRDLEALWPIADGQQRVVFIADTENEIHRALDMAKEFDLRPVIAGGREAWRVASRLRETKVPVILSPKWSESPLKKYEKRIKQQKKKQEQVPPQEPEEPASEPRAQLRPVFDQEWEQQPFESQAMIDERLRLWHEQVDNALRLHEAGVPFALGSFALPAPKDLLKNIRQAIERGLPEDAALAALTSTAADVLEIEAQLGQISEGKLANLTVLNKPFADSKAKVEWVFVEGQRFDYSQAATPKKKDQKPDQPDAGDDRGSSEDQHEADARPDDAGEETAGTTPSETDTAVPGAPPHPIETDPSRRPAIQTGGDLLIKNATLLTITGGDLQQTDLLIKDGRIARIGANISAPDGVMAVDLTGYHVMPGIIDAHSHMCSDGGLNESSLSVTCEVKVTDIIDHRDVGAYRALAGGVTTIHTMHGSANTIGGQNAIVRLKYGRPVSEWHFGPAPRTVKFALGENVKQANFGQRGTRFPNTRMGVEAVLRRTFDEANRYQAAWGQYKKDQASGNDPRPLRRDLRLEALIEILDGRIWVNTHCYRADEVLRLFEVAEDYGFRVAVLHHILEGFKIIPEIRRHGCGTATFSDWWAYKLEAYDAVPHNAARMVQGGVLASVKSDSGEVIRHLNLEAAKSLRYGGLEPNDALRLVTLNVAMQFGIDGYVGSLEVGKYADIAVFDGHPLDTFSKNVLTLIDGEVYFQHRELDLDAPTAPLAAGQLASGAALLPIEPSASGNYWITGAKVHPVSGPPIEDGVVAIQGGRISWIGPGQGRRPPAGARIVDARGLRVYPGLINAGTSLGLTEISSVKGSVDASEIGNFQPDLLAVSAYHPDSAMINVTRAEGITRAVVMAGRATVAGQAGVVRLEGWTMPEAVLERRLGLCINLPSLPVEYPRQMSAEEKKKDAERKKAHGEKLRELEEFFRDAALYAEARKQSPDRSELSADYDRRLEAMIPYVTGAKPVFMRADSYKKISEALRFAERYNLRPVIYGGREAWKLADELAGKKVDVILIRSMAYPISRFEQWDSVYRCAAALDQAGVRFCFATGGASLAKNLGLEAGMAVAHGLDAQRALQAITVRAAEILGLADEVGSLEPSKVADLIITTDTPLQAANRVLAVFISGRPVPLTSRHTQMDEKYQARPAPALQPARQLKGPPHMVISVERVAGSR